jgi:tetratricopeptide (TPR) repeat protein
MTAIRNDPDALAALEEERDFLLRSLDDLESEYAAGDVDDADYAHLKDSYIARTAEVLRALNSSVATTRPARPTSRRRTFVTVGIVAVVAVAVALFLPRALGERSAGQSITGNASETENGLLVQARQLQETDAEGALKLFEQVLQTDPDNAEALTYSGWLLARIAGSAVQRNLTDVSEQLMKQAEQSIDRAISVAPTYADPYCFKAIIRFRFYNDAAGAKGPIATCVASNPPAAVADLVTNLATEIDAALTSGTTAVAPTTTAP